MSKKKHKKYHSKTKTSSKGRKMQKSHIKPAIRTDIRPKEIIKSLSVFFRLKINDLKRIIDSDLEVEGEEKPKPRVVATVTKEISVKPVAEVDEETDVVPVTQKIKLFVTDNKNIKEINIALGVFLAVVVCVFVFSVCTMHRVNIAYDDVVSQSEKLTKKYDKLNEKYQKLKPNYDMLNEEYEKLHQSAEDAKNSNLTAIEESTVQTTEVAQ